MQFNQRSDSVDLFSLVAETSFEPDWIEPKFRFEIITLDVDVRRFAAVACVEEEPVRPNAKYGRHVRHIIAMRGGQQQGSPRITTTTRILDSWKGTAS